MYKTEEQRLRHIEDMIEDIHAWLIMGQERIPGKAEYDRAIQELLKGNTKPLSLYKQRGGIIPKADPELLPSRFRTRKTQQIREIAAFDDHYPSNGGHAERPFVKKRRTADPSGKPPAGRHNPERKTIDKDRSILSGPGMLPGEKEQRRVV